MISICENGLGAEVFHFLHSKSFDSSARGGTDKSRSLNIAVRRMNDANTSQIVVVGNIEF